MVPHQLQRHRKMASSSSSTLQTKYFTDPWLQPAGSKHWLRLTQVTQHPESSQKVESCLQPSAFFPDQEDTRIHAMQGCLSWNVQSWSVLSTKLLTLSSCREETHPGLEVLKTRHPNISKYAAPRSELQLQTSSWFPGMDPWSDLLSSRGEPPEDPSPCPTSKLSYRGH